MAKYIHTNGGRGATSTGSRIAHIVIAERALGKLLKKENDVHHVNENDNDNTNSNLVVCEDRAYHKLLHLRAAALRICGNASWRKCSLCHKYDDPKNLYIKENNKHGPRIYHRKCHAAYNKAWSARKVAGVYD